eukprot:g5148.t1
MGLCATRTLPLSDSSEKLLQTYAGVLSALGLTRAQGAVFAHAFSEYDKRGDGSIDYGEFLATMRGTKSSKFSRRCFSLLDQDGSKSVTFSEFLVCTFLICTTPEEKLPYFAYSLYDTDRSGQLEKDEVEAIIHEVYDVTNQDRRGEMIVGEVKEDTEKRLADVMRGIEKYTEKGPKGKGQVITPKGFAAFCQTRKNALFPAFVMIRTVRSSISSSSSLWKGMRKARENLASNGLGADGKDVDSDDAQAIIDAIGKSPIAASFRRFNSLEGAFSGQDDVSNTGSNLERLNRRNSNSKGQSAGGGGQNKQQQQQQQQQQAAAAERRRSTDSASGLAKLAYVGESELLRRGSKGS